jgi:hypothetical protein
MARKRDDGRVAADFAQRVLEVLMKVQAGKASSEKDRDVRRVAVGLAFITHGVKNYSQMGAGADSGASEALAIVDALTSGREHPIWRYIRGVRAFKYRSQDAPVNGIDAERQHMIIGVALAYQEQTHCSESDAIRVVARACSLPDLPLDAELIEKSWLKNLKNKPSTRPRAMRAIRGWQDLIRKRAQVGGLSESPSDRILEAGRWLIWRASSVPVIQAEGETTDTH